MNLIPGINVGNAFKQLGSFVGLAPKGDYDVLDSYTNSNRPGQSQVNNGFDFTSGSNPVNSPSPIAANPGSPVNRGVLGESFTGSASGAPRGGGGASYPALNQAGVDNTQLALDQLPGLLRAALEAEATRRGNVIAGFNNQEQGQRKVYDESTTTNQQNYDSNYMDSIRAGIKGLGSLFNILRGTGAAGGTAEDLARDTVGGVTANDIRTGADTQKGNQAALDTSLSTFLTDLKSKRQMADDTFENNQRAIQRDNAVQMQDLFGKLAGFYGDAGRTGEAQNFMSRAGALTPEIAKNSVTSQSAYDTTPVAVQAPQLSAFSAPSQPNVAVVPQDGQVGSGIFTMSRKKERQQSPVALPVGA